MVVITDIFTFMSDKQSRHSDLMFFANFIEFLKYNEGPGGSYF